MHPATTRALARLDAIREAYYAGRITWTDCAHRTRVAWELIAQRPRLHRAVAAELRYRSALKRARLYNAATKNDAPEEKLRPIRDEVKAWLAAETAARTARLRDLEAELATLS